MTCHFSLVSNVVNHDVPHTIVHGIVQWTVISMKSCAEQRETILFHQPRKGHEQTQRISSEMWLATFTIMQSSQCFLRLDLTSKRKDTSWFLPSFSSFLPPLSFLRCRFIVPSVRSPCLSQSHVGGQRHQISPYAQHGKVKNAIPETRTADEES